MSSGYYYFSREKPIDQYQQYQNHNPCSYLEKQNQELITVLLNIRQTITSKVETKSQPTSYRFNERLNPMYAAYTDTIPRKRKQLSKKDSSVIKSIDSILKKVNYIQKSKA